MDSIYKSNILSKGRELKTANQTDKLYVVVYDAIIKDHPGFVYDYYDEKNVRHTRLTYQYVSLILTMYGITSRDEYYDC